jgi:hypothetical protein
VVVQVLEVQVRAADADGVGEQGDQLGLAYLVGEGLAWGFG